MVRLPSKLPPSIRKTPKAEIIVKTDLVKRLAGELQVSDAYIEALGRYVELLVLRSADRCRKNQRKRLNEADV